MERRVAALGAEVVESESAKFTVPMVLLHGLWSSAALWRPFMGYLAHRGWRCIALQLRDASSLAAMVEEVRRAVATLAAPPVLLGHDLGGTLAHQLADAATATVSLAPLVFPPLATRVPPSLTQAGTIIDRLFARPRRAPRGPLRAAYPAHAHARPESAELITCLSHTRLDLHDGAMRPGLIMMGDQDPVTDIGAARALAERTGSELLSEPTASHALPVDAEWERRVSDIHRWLVRTLGQPLLALYDESMAESE